MANNYLNRKWNSLLDFKDYIEKHTTEKIEYFDGARLITNKNHYSLAFGQVFVEKKDA